MHAKQGVIASAEEQVPQISRSCSKLLQAPISSLDIAVPRLVHIQFVPHVGADLLTLTASSPGGSFINNGLPTIYVGFTVECAHDSPLPCT